MALSAHRRAAPLLRHLPVATAFPFLRNLSSDSTATLTLETSVPFTGHKIDPAYYKRGDYAPGLKREDNSSIGFLFPPKIHDAGPLTRILLGTNPSLSQLNLIVPLRRFSASAEGDESRLQGTSASIPDVPAHIKFKRLDKTARNIMNILDREAVEEVKIDRELPDIRPGYIVQLKVEVPENKRRVSIVKGIVIARRNAGLNTTIRLRRLVAGVGVESLFPLYSPNLKEIKVLEKKKVRRAKLYYLRDKMNALKKN